MWQYIIAGAVLLAAIIYMIRVVVRSMRSDGHDCPDCEVVEKKPKVVRKR